MRVSMDSDVLCLVLLALVLSIEAGPKQRRQIVDSVQNDSDTTRGNKLPLQNVTSQSQMQSTTEAKTGKVDPSEMDLIFFPDSPKIEGVPSCAQGNTFCENFEPYPDKQVQQILKTANITVDPVKEEDEDTDNEEKSVCQSVRRTIYPKAARNKNDNWKVIVNQIDTEYNQGVVVETCSHKENAPCEVVGELLNKYMTKCREKYTHRKLLSLGDDGKLEWEYFLFPAGCYCAFRRRYPFLSNSPKSSDTSQKQ